MASPLSTLANSEALRQNRPMLTGAQIRAARALLRWTTGELAKRADVGIATVHRAEASDAMPSMNTRTLMKLKNTFEASNIEFLDPGQASAAGGMGVRFRST